MHPRRFAFIAGAVMLVMGLCSLIPGWTGSEEGLFPLDIDTSYGLFLGFFPLNIISKIALIALGFAGIICATMQNVSLPMSIKYARLIFVVMAVATLLGMIPQTRTLFGLWPLFGGQIWLNGVLTVLGVYFGYTLTSKIPDLGKPNLPRSASR